MRRLIALVALGLIAVTGSAAGDADAGKAKSEACSICHGADGKSGLPEYPKLAGQNAKYLAYSLKNYKQGLRKGNLAGYMTPAVMALSDKDIEDLAAYYASLAP